MTIEPKIFGRFDAEDLRARLAAAGIPKRLAERGFRDLEVVVDPAGALPRVQLFGCKAGGRHRLIDAILGETSVEPGFFRSRGVVLDAPLELALVYWLREEDPTLPFPPGRPALPLQEHPGLGCLRRAFRVVVSMAQELSKDGVASVPKLFHDAVLFHRSRLFLFLDGERQGWFEALCRDLDALPLAEASLAVAAGCVTDAAGSPVVWSPALQVFPLSGRATGWFHSEAYGASVGRGYDGARFSLDRRRLEEACRGPSAPADSPGGSA